jgi:hypothetical protein
VAWRLELRLADVGPRVSKLPWRGGRNAEPRVDDALDGDEAVLRLGVYGSAGPRGGGLELRLVGGEPRVSVGRGRVDQG